MTAKDKYRNLCETESTIPIFSKAWWLDAVCGEDKWDVCIVEKGGMIHAAMPFYMPKSRVITMPPLTQALGPWLRPSKAKYANMLSEQKEMMTLLISQLPPFNSFHQNFHYSITNWLPFYWKGFQQTTRYTYTIENLLDLKEVLFRFKDNMRNKINKARKIVSVTDEGSVEEFYALNKKTFERQGLNIPYSLNFIIQKDRLLADRGCRKIFFAVDKEGHIHSALYLIWDGLSSYVHMVGEDPFLRKSGAGILLIYESIKFTRDFLGLDCYDFEGSMIESVEEVRRACGGVQRPYFSISKINSRLLKFKQAIIIFKNALLNR